MFPIQAEELAAETTRINLPVPDPYVHEAPRQITGEEREFEAYRTLRNERATARNEGKRKVREAKVRFCLLSGQRRDLTRRHLCRRPRRRRTRRSKPLVRCLCLFCTTLAPCYHSHYPCTQKLARSGLIASYATCMNMMITHLVGRPIRTFGLLEQRLESRTMGADTRAVQFY